MLILKHIFILNHYCGIWQKKKKICSLVLLYEVKEFEGATEKSNSQRIFSYILLFTTPQRKSFDIMSKV